jgi:hypothetical protein
LKFFDLFRRHPVIPAKAGIQLKINNPRSGQNLIVRLRRNCLTNWIPAFAGMTADGGKGARQKFQTEALPYRPFL